MVTAIQLLLKYTNIKNGLVIGANEYLNNSEDILTIVDEDVHNLNLMKPTKHKLVLQISKDIDSKFDRVLIHPQTHTANEVIYNQILDSKRVLQQNGYLVLVAHTKGGGKSFKKYMKEIFGNVKIQEKKARFRVLSSIKKDSEIQPRLVLEKSFSYKRGGKEYAFNTSKGIFSYGQIDAGTDLLLKNLELVDNKKLLDVGCGYGPIGIVFSDKFGKVEMIDSSLQAVNMAKENITRNKIKNAKAYVSDCLDEVKGSFDVIISNPPTHAGFGVLSRIFEQAFNKLVKNGKFYIIINKILNYDRFLKKFSSKEIIAENRQYKVILYSK
jgi:16S rRNA (guanine1207-N2)-methyltransferase